MGLLVLDCYYISQCFRLSSGVISDHPGSVCLGQGFYDVCLGTIMCGSLGCDFLSRFVTPVLVVSRFQGPVRCMTSSCMQRVERRGRTLQHIAEAPHAGTARC